MPNELFGAGGRTVLSSGGRAPEEDDGALGGEPYLGGETGAGGRKASSGGSEMGGESSSGGGDADDDGAGGVIASGGGAGGEPAIGGSSTGGDGSGGSPAALEPDAGFIEVIGRRYASNGLTQMTPTHRVFYSFHPSDLGKDAPLAVFFNGGPGSSTATLMGMSTAPRTLDPHLTGAAQGSVPNPVSWTRGMHVLYIDAPSTGFSYTLPPPDGPEVDAGIDLDREAGVFVEVLLAFLEKHSELACNQVILVGESYGGTRATLMLQHLLFPERLEQTSWIYVDPELTSKIREHESNTTNCHGGEVLPLQEQFNAQVLIQPVVLGRVQWDRNSPDPSVCLSGGSYDDYQCDKPRGYMNAVWADIARKLTTLGTLEDFLGVDPQQIEWFYADQRLLAYGKSPAFAPRPLELEEVFGLLNSKDAYHLDDNEEVRNARRHPARWWDDPRIAPQFLENLRTVKTLITNAPYDMVVESTAIIRGIENMPSVVSSIQRIPDPVAPRGGWYEITYLDGHRVHIRMPTYEAAGHCVTLFASGDLLYDVMSLLEDSAPPPAPEEPALARKQRVFEPPPSERLASETYLGP